MQSCRPMGGVVAMGWRQHWGSHGDKTNNIHSGLSENGKHAPVMAISSIKNDGFPSGYRWVLSLSHGSAMGATSEAKQDNLREVESQVAALQKLLSGTQHWVTFWCFRWCFDDVQPRIDKPRTEIWGSPSGDHLLPKWYRPKWSTQECHWIFINLGLTNVDELRFDTFHFQQVSKMIPTSPADFGKIWAQAPTIGQSTCECHAKWPAFLVLIPQIRGPNNTGESV